MLLKLKNNKAVLDEKRRLHSSTTQPLNQCVNWTLVCVLVCVYVCVYVVMHTLKLMCDKNSLAKRIANENCLMEVHERLELICFVATYTSRLAHGHTNTHTGTHIHIEHARTNTMVQRWMVFHADACKSVRTVWRCSMPMRTRKSDRARAVCTRDTYPTRTFEESFEVMIFFVWWLCTHVCVSHSAAYIDVSIVWWKQHTQLHRLCDWLTCGTRWQERERHRTAEMRTQMRQTETQRAVLHIARKIYTPFA